MNKHQDNTLEIPFSIIFLGNIDEASRPWTIGTERFKLETRIIGNDGTTTVLNAGVLKLTQLTTGKTRIEYFELSSLMQDDLKLIW